MVVMGAGWVVVMGAGWVVVMGARWVVVMGAGRVVVMGAGRVGDGCSVGMGKMGSQLKVTVTNRPFREALTPFALGLADSH